VSKGSTEGDQTQNDEDGSGDLTNVYRRPATHLQLHILVGYRSRRSLLLIRLSIAASAYHE